MRGIMQKVRGMRMGSKGQLSISNLFAILALVIGAVIVVPISYQLIQAISNNVDPLTMLVLSMIPLAIIAGVIKTIIDYSNTTIAYFTGKRE